ncbi:MAG: hypothetical protein WBQ27_21095, partial [Thermoanaerobaculia bacterium]
WQVVKRFDTFDLFRIFITYQGIKNQPELAELLTLQLLGNRAILPENPFNTILSGQIDLTINGWLILANGNQ